MLVRKLEQMRATDDPRFPWRHRVPLGVFAHLLSFLHGCDVARVQQLSMLYSDMVQNLDAVVVQPIQICLMHDLTSSMGTCFQNVKRWLLTFIPTLQKRYPRRGFEYTLVGYRDMGDSDLMFLRKFTPSVATLLGWIQGLRCSGGGDLPEAVRFALHNAYHHLNWRRRATKLVLLLTDAPCHSNIVDPQVDQQYEIERHVMAALPERPVLHDWFHIANTYRQHDIRILPVLLRTQGYVDEAIDELSKVFYAILAHITRGLALSVYDAQELTPTLTALLETWFAHGPASRGATSATSSDGLPFDLIHVFDLEHAALLHCKTEEMAMRLGLLAPPYPVAPHQEVPPPCVLPPCVLPPCVLPPPPRLVRSITTGGTLHLKTRPRESSGMPCIPEGEEDDVLAMAPSILPRNPVRRKLVRQYTTAQTTAVAPQHLVHLVRQRSADLRVT
jgi:hypothetical protein